MKRTLIIAAAILCSSMALLAQPKDVGPCQLALEIPEDFTEVDRTRDGYIYEHRRNGSQLILTKTSSKEDLFALKTVALERFAGLMADNSKMAPSIEEVADSQQPFYLLKWTEVRRGGKEVLMVTAISERCGRLYEFRLETAEKYAEKMLPAFRQMVGTTTAS